MSHDVALRLLDDCTGVLREEKTLLRLDGDVLIVGDIHGQFFDLVRMFEVGGPVGPNRYLFLGDYVDRGKNGLEVICLLLAYKIKYPENFFLLRGNHECASINRIYGFYDECKRRFNIKMWKKFQYFSRKVYSLKKKQKK